VPSVSPVWIRDEGYADHDIPGHPESPRRIEVLEASLARHDWFGWERRQAPAATRAQLEGVHPAAYVDFLESLSAAGGGAIDADTAATSRTFAAAARAAGGAVAAVDALFAGAPAAFSAGRPPGHHAEAARAMGFCFLNSVAVAARHAQAAHGVQRVLIFDWDVHHGNGTNDVFHADPAVLFISIHESPLYPGTGPASDVGSGAGRGATVNLPVPPGAGDAQWTSLVEHVVAPLMRAHAPGLVLVSAGFDAHVDDPLARCRVTEAGYATMTRTLRRACDELGVPLGMVLEGGYAVRALAGSIAAVLPVLAGRDEPLGEPPAGVLPLAVDPLAMRAAERLRPWWPGVREALSAA
jgi:acetoin utilization deacetylase AcuC-like enzyme